MTKVPTVTSVEQLLLRTPTSEYLSVAAFAADKRQIQFWE